ncbi:proteasome maturation protein [Anthonomus grandis grandis]|uniref:proteasome maturation protein n=1 Tax=Anthonomus grandis grandis TaxID=2921223 RepID=UPI002165AC00|nr:proteasome maturation protein [Anthonomus grandis grandis]
MSFGLPSLKSKPSQPQEYGFEEGEFGVPELMKTGLGSARGTIDNVHPLAQSEKNYRQNADKMNMQVLRNIQGLHAPLKIAMELQSAKKIGHLPFLKSSNVMLESLTGRDLEMAPEDLFNTGEFLEITGQPHAMVERSLGIF